MGAQDGTSVLRSQGRQTRAPLSTMLGQQEGGCLGTRKQVLSRNCICWLLELGLAASGTVRDTWVWCQCPCLWNWDSSLCDRDDTSTGRRGHLDRNAARAAPGVQPRIHRPPDSSLHLNLPCKPLSRFTQANSPQNDPRLPSPSPSHGICLPGRGPPSLLGPPGPPACLSACARTPPSKRPFRPYQPEGAFK